MWHTTKKYKIWLATNNQNRRSCCPKQVNTTMGNCQGIRSIKVVGKTPQDQLQNWETHFKELLGKPPLPSDDPTLTIISKQLPTEMGDFTLAELLVSIKSMSNDKSCGLNEIPTKSWKTGQLSDVLLLVCNKALKGNILTAWKQLAIIPFPKKGNLHLPENYRGISLTLVAAKIYNQRILSHITIHTDPLL